MASRWLPSVCRQYKVLSWGSSHSMTHFLSRKREWYRQVPSLQPSFPRDGDRLGRPMGWSSVKPDSLASFTSNPNGERRLCRGLL